MRYASRQTALSDFTAANCVATLCTGIFAVWLIVSIPAGTVVAGVMDVMLTGAVALCGIGTEVQPVEAAKRMRRI
jgi:hypothetical protein